MRRRGWREIAVLGETLAEMMMIAPECLARRAHECSYLAIVWHDRFVYEHFSSVEFLS